MNTSVAAVYIGGIAPLPPEGAPTGIFKRAAAGPIRLGLEGLEGDRQADRRVHGGPEKAVHHYAAENYGILRSAFPAAAAAFVPGSLGENLSTRGWTEDGVCVGDVWRVGTATVQVSQPRSPCWKINHKFGIDELSRLIAERGIAGWYYRVLEPGVVAAGDGFELIERNSHAVTLKRLWLAQLSHRPDVGELDFLRGTPGLSPNWVQKLDQRIAWLRSSADGTK